MKSQIKSITVCVFVLLSMLVTRQSYAQGARLQLDRLARLADKAKEVVDVNLDEPMLQQASAMSGKQPDEKTKAVLQGLKGVYVKSFEFDGPGGYSEADVEAIRTQLKAPGWSRIISVREKGELTEIYSWNDAGGSGGLAIITAEASELTVVNLVGRINMAQLGALKGLGVPVFPSIGK